MEVGRSTKACCSIVRLKGVCTTTSTDVSGTWENDVEAGNTAPVDVGGTWETVDGDVDDTTYVDVGGTCGLLDKGSKVVPYKIKDQL